MLILSLYYPYNTLMMISIRTVLLQKKSLLLLLEEEICFIIFLVSLLIEMRLLRG